MELQIHQGTFGLADISVFSFAWIQTVTTLESRHETCVKTLFGPTTLDQLCKLRLDF